MTGVPPFAAPSYHWIVIDVAVFALITSAKVVGTSGVVRIIAPLPSKEVTEEP